MTTAEITARALLKRRPLDKLIADFEMTESMQTTVELAMTRGWIMDELENRNPAAFEAWIDSYTDSPRKFFL